MWAVCMSSLCCQQPSTKGAVLYGAVLSCAVTQPTGEIEAREGGLWRSNQAAAPSSCLLGGSPDLAGGK